MIPYHPQYHAINAGAHRKPASRIGNPALIRHVGVWIPSARDESQNGNATKFALRRRDWQNAIDKFIATFMEELFRASEFNRALPNDRLCDSIVDQKLMLFRHRIEVTEPGKAACSFPLIDLSPANETRQEAYKIISLNVLWRGIPTKIRLELHTEYFTITLHLDPSNPRFPESTRAPSPTMAKLMGGLEELSRYILRREPYSEPGQSENHPMGRIHRRLVHQIWDEFDAVMFSEKTWDARRLGRVFADFRGMLLGEVDFRQTSLNIGDPGEVLSRDVSVRIADRLVSFLDCREEEVSMDYCLSGFLKGRVLYASALGPQPLLAPTDSGASTDSRSHVPLSYILFTNIGDRYRLGRLVDRVNSLGTYRLAALMDNYALRDVGEKLRDVGVQLDALTEHIQHAERKGKEPTLRSLNERLRSLFVETNAPTADVDGGVAYRVERARYYVKQFHELLPGLRERRVEGFQKYSEFVVKRLAPTYDYIDRLGTRLERSQLRIRGLVDQIRAAVLTELQLAAELFLLLLIVPYYVIQVLSKALENRWIVVPVLVVFAVIAYTRYRKLR